MPSLQRDTQKEETLLHTEDPVKIPGLQSQVSGQDLDTSRTALRKDIPIPRVIHPKGYGAFQLGERLSHPCCAATSGVQHLPDLCHLASPGGLAL